MQEVCWQLDMFMGERKDEDAASFYKLSIWQCYISEA